MARTGILPQHVSAAAETLLSEGQQPTIRAVRERLGDTGSPNTIQRHLAAWRKSRQRAEVPPALPPSLASVIATELAKVATTAREAAQAEIEQAQLEAADLAKAGEAVEAERDELAAQVQALRSERDTLTGKLDSLQAQADRLHVDLLASRQQEQEAQKSAAVAGAQVQASLDRATRAEAALQQQAQDLATALQEAAHLRGKLETMLTKQKKEP